MGWCKFFGFFVSYNVIVVFLLGCGGVYGHSLERKVVRVPCPAGSLTVHVYSQSEGAIVLFWCGQHYYGGWPCNNSGSLLPRRSVCITTCVCIVEYFATLLWHSNLCF